MSTTIRTSSENYFNRIQKYLNNKRIFFSSSFCNETYELTIFNLTSLEINTLIQKLTQHFHLFLKQQEPLALAA